MKLAAFPKAFIDQISSGQMPLPEWISIGASLDVDGLELYEHFFTSFDSAYLDDIRARLDDHGIVMPMLCCSPDFTHPDPAARSAAINRHVELIQVARHLGGPGVACRVLSGQRHPGVDRARGVRWVLDAFAELLSVAKELDVVLAMENHYKDGNWRYPEFAQRREVFLEIVDAVEDRTHFGVQYDPSNALVAGDDPVDFLRAVANRVVTMQASDRALAPGASLNDLREADGTLGYSPLLQHGVVGRGLNNYDAIFSILREVGYDGWISIEDGVNGLQEMADSLAFLRTKIAQVPAEDSGSRIGDFS
ncbi:sugar phosphate isomerase/epimerase family protein [Nocardia sp. NPDC051463]|uniref:sugar phosphate isomerase/epimerase family protein n=1 Tax=Nocardia sp. NPDC051463 TaxID=3154845 RepID=UPI00344B31DD